MVEHFSGFQIDQAKTEFLGTTAEAVNHPCAVQLEIGRGAGVVIGDVAPQHTVNQYRQLAGGGGDGRGRAQSVGQATIIGPQSSGAAGEAYGGAAQDRRRAIGRGLGPGTEHPLAGDLVVGGQRQPSGEVLFSAPATPVRTNLRNQLPYPIGSDAVDLAEIGAAGNARHGRAQLHAWFVLAGLGPGFGRRQRLCGRLAGLRQIGQLGLNGLVAVGDLSQIELEALKVLAQRKQVFATVIAGQGGAYLLLIGFAITVAMRRQLVRVAYPGQDVPHDRQAGDAGDVAEHILQLQVHLGQGLLHAINAGGGGFHQGLAVAHIAAQCYDLASRTKTRMEQTDAMEFLQPLAVLDVGLAPAHVMHLVGVDQHHLQPAFREYFVERDPVDPGRLHRHRLDAALHQPIGQLMKAAGESAELTHRLGITVGSYRREVAGGATVDAGCVGLNTLEQWGDQAGRLVMPPWRVSGSRLLFMRASPIVKLLEVSGHRSAMEQTLS
jgi:hypothetical protein